MADDTSNNKPSIPDPFSVPLPPPQAMASERRAITEGVEFGTILKGNVGPSENKGSQSGPPQKK